MTVLHPTAYRGLQGWLSRYVRQRPQPQDQNKYLVQMIGPYLTREEIAQAAVEVTVPVVEGEHNPASIHRAILDTKGALQRCYAVERRLWPEHSGRILLKFSIEQDGRVHHRGTQGTWAEESIIAACSQQVLLKAHFPRPQRAAVAVRQVIEFLPRGPKT